MPDDALQDNRPQILKDLDDFNTAPEFGMMGILQEQLNEQAPEPAEPPKEDKPAEPAKPEYDYEKAYAPLNSTIQELGYRMDARIGDIERNLAQQRQQVPQPEPQYDPEQPVTMAQLVALQQEVRNTGRQSEDAQLRSEYLRAHLEYERFKHRNPDFTVTPQEIDAAFSRHMDLNRARNTNWTGHFAQIYEQTTQPRMKNRIAELEKQVEELSKKATRAEAPPKPISPATATQRSASGATSSRIIESPASGSQLDIVNLPSFKKGKSFKTFANDIKRHYGITNR
jgi:hypothetical protein